MQYLSADIILPITGNPCCNSILALNDNGTIEGIYSKSQPEMAGISSTHYSGILCPGFVNTHCHLELSWAKGLIPERSGLDAFVRQLEQLKKTQTDASIQASISNAALEMEKSGIVATADISNTDHTVDFKRNSKQHFHTFIEIFGSNPAFASAIFEKAHILQKQFHTTATKHTSSIVPHATYSLSENLFRLIASLGKENVISIHHQENNDENSFFYDGSGPIALRRKAFNPDLPEWSGTGLRPMQSIGSFFDPGQKVLLVHNTISEQEDIAFIEQNLSHAYWCLCLNANMYIENKLPPVELLRSNSCKITLGTDSLASNHQLSIFHEIKTIHASFPKIPLQEVFQWGTLNGAEFLDLEKQLGSFEQDKQPGVVFIDHIDMPNLHLTNQSTSHLIIPAVL